MDELGIDKSIITESGRLDRAFGILFPIQKKLLTVNNRVVVIAVDKRSPQS